MPAAVSNPCPECGKKGNIRTSKKITADTREKYFQCTNTDCSSEWKSIESIIFKKRQRTKTLKPNMLQLA